MCGKAVLCASLMLMVVLSSTSAITISYSVTGFEATGITDEIGCIEIGGGTVCNMAILANDGSYQKLAYYPYSGTAELPNTDEWFYFYALPFCVDIDDLGLAEASGYFNTPRVVTLEGIPWSTMESNVNGNWNSGLPWHKITLSGEGSIGIAASSSQESTMWTYDLGTRGKVDMCLPVFAALYVGIGIGPPGSTYPKRMTSQAPIAFRWHSVPPKMWSNGHSVSLSDAIVTLAETDFFYASDSERRWGIRVDKPLHELEAGMRADVQGTVETDANGERYVAASSVTRADGHGIVYPLYMNHRSLGGEDLEYDSNSGKGQRGVHEGSGPNNIGRLVTVSGVVRYVESAGAFAYIDDGSGCDDGNALGLGGEPVKGIRVLSPTSSLILGSTVTVTGVSTIETVAGRQVRAVRMRGDAELTTEQDFSIPSGGIIRMCRVPSGAFLMGKSDAGDDVLYGSTKETPQHEVQLSSYWIGKHPVTRGQYRLFMESDGYTNSTYWSTNGWSWRASIDRQSPDFWDEVQDWGTGEFRQTDRHPVVGVTYYEAEAFCNWAGLRLPTEAEWEKSARWDDRWSPTPWVYPWGHQRSASKCNNVNDINPLGGGGMRHQTSPVRAFPDSASRYGLLDMAGNVREWCKDWYSNTYYSQTPEGGWIDPQGPSSGWERVLRGAGWDAVSISMRCARRDSRLPNGSPFPTPGQNNVGFRVAKTSDG